MAINTHRNPAMLLDYARLTLDANGQPHSDHYHDIYYNPGAGFAESEHVFINGNRLHARFAHARSLTIGEVGYGTGLNFIHTADTFLREAPADARLHYLSFELHPIAAETLAALQRDWPQPEIRAAILAQNPHNHPGGGRGGCAGFVRGWRRGVPAAARRVAGRRGVRRRWGAGPS